MARSLAPYIAIQTGWPSLWLGGPGTGKTKHTYQISDVLRRGLGHEPGGFPLVDIVLNTSEPSDVTGLPLIKGSTVERALPDWFSVLTEAGRGILFIDELTTSAPALQAAALKLINERKIDSHRLSDEVWIVACANPADEAAGGWDLAPPMANRFWHYEWTVSPMDWADSFRDEFPEPTIPMLPPSWKAHVGEYRGLISGFIRSRQELLYQLPEDEVEAGRAWPSPRTWDMTADLLAAAKAVNTDGLSTTELVTGATGRAGLELLTYIEQLDLPNPLELLRDPESFELPERGDLQYAIISSVGGAICKIIGDEIRRGVKDLSAHDHTWMSAWKILGAAARGGAADIATPTARKMCLACWDEKNENNGLTVPTEYMEPYIEMLTAMEFFK